MISPKKSQGRSEGSSSLCLTHTKTLPNRRLTLARRRRDDFARTCALPVAPWPTPMKGISCLESSIIGHRRWLRFPLADNSHTTDNVVAVVENTCIRAMTSYSPEHQIDLRRFLQGIKQGDLMSLIRVRKADDVDSLSMSNDRWWRLGTLSSIATLVQFRKSDPVIFRLGTIQNITEPLGIPSRHLDTELRILGLFRVSPSCYATRVDTYI